jgi:hypothetical protein
MSPEFSWYRHCQLGLYYKGNWVVKLRSGFLFVDWARVKAVSGHVSKHEDLVKAGLPFLSATDTKSYTRSWNVTGSCLLILFLVLDIKNYHLIHRPFE